MSGGLGDGPRLVVLASGGGSNLQAIVEAIRDRQLHARLVSVISDVADAFALERARQAGVAAIGVDYRAFPDRPAAETALAKELDEQEAAIVVLAGFMRILPAQLVTRYQGRMLNIHPSLLPRYRGLHTYRRVLEAGDAWHGSTVHFVVPELDAGPAILQYRIPVRPGDTEDSLRQRVQRGEHRIYPEAIDWLATERLCLRDGRAWLDGKPLASPERVDEN